MQTSTDNAAPDRFTHEWASRAPLIALAVLGSALPASAQYAQREQLPGAGPASRGPSALESWLVARAGGGESSARRPREASRRGGTGCGTTQNSSSTCLGPSAMAACGRAG